MKKSLLCLMLFLGTIPMMAQKALVRKGDFYFKQMAYSEAIPYYTKALKKDSTLQDATFRLADCYRLTNNRKQAEIWLEKAVNFPSVTPIYKFYYGQSLMNNGRYARARKWMEDFVLDNKEDGRGQAFARAIDTYENFFVDSSNYAVTKLDINSTNADFGVALYDDGIVFASSRKQPELIERTHSWTNESFLSLYYSRGKETSFRAPESFANKINSKFNDGPVCFNKKGDEIWVTRNNIEGTKVHKSKDKVVKLKIFTAKSSGNDWGKLESFQYNSDEYNCAHPAVSADGKRLYFSSDMPGGKGGMDIYMCEKAGNSWGKPINLGDTINTKGSDVFPIVMEDGTLYFASDGHPGIGGLDIYYTRDLGNRYVVPVNVGFPLNTPDDDFGMVYDLKNKIGYLSSNRANRGIDDDIYTFKKKTLRIKGIVINKETGAPVKEAKVNLKFNDKQLNFTTLENGRFDFPAEFDQKYAISGTAEGLGDTLINFETVSSSPTDPFVRIELGKPSGFAITITVLDAETKQPIPGAVIRDEVTAKDLGSTDIAGEYKQAIVPEKDEQIQILIAGYRPKVIMLKGQEGETPKDLNYTVELTPAPDVHPFENWYKIIYYDLDKYNIRPNDAEKTMEEIYSFLKENPQVKISISSHTDSRASKEYNERLSENRSKSIQNYLRDKGIPSKQIGKVVWSGEGVMVNKCGDDEPCTEEMHQLNRRTEITVMGILK